MVEVTRSPDARMRMNPSKQPQRARAPVTIEQSRAREWLDMKIYVDHGPVDDEDDKREEED